MYQIISNGKKNEKNRTLNSKLPRASWYFREEPSIAKTYKSGRLVVLEPKVLDTVGEQNDKKDIGYCFHRDNAFFFNMRTSNINII